MNSHPTCAACCALMKVYLIGMDNQPVIRPVGIGETWQSYFTKCVLVVFGPEAQEADRTEQLYGGMESGIKGGIHVIRLLWKNHSQEESWGFLLIATRNKLNYDNHNTMLWVVQHEWPRGTQFTFNCYHHWAFM